MLQTHWLREGCGRSSGAGGGPGCELSPTITVTEENKSPRHSSARRPGTELHQEVGLDGAAGLSSHPPAPHTPSLRSRWGGGQSSRSRTARPKAGEGPSDPTSQAAGGTGARRRSDAAAQSRDAEGPLSLCARSLGLPGL